MLLLLFRFLFAAVYPGVRNARSPYSFSGIYEEGRSLHSNAKDFTQLLRSAADSIDTFERYTYVFNIYRLSHLKTSDSKWL